MTAKNLGATRKPGVVPASAQRSVWSLFWAVVVPISTIAAAAATGPGVPEPVRAATVAWFLSVCPGMALVRHMRLGQPLLEIAVAVALSLALASLVASILLYLGTWSPAVTFAVLVAIAAAGTILDLAVIARTMNARRRQVRDRSVGSAAESMPKPPRRGPDRVGTFARGLASPLDDAADAPLQIAVDRVVGDLAERPRQGE